MIKNTIEYLDKAADDINRQRESLLAQVQNCNGALEFIGIMRAEAMKPELVPPAETEERTDGNQEGQ